MKLPEKIKAILFDMDGVLVDSLDSWFYAFNNALEHHQEQPLSKQAFIDTYWGHDLYDNLDRAGLDRAIGPFCNQIFGNHIEKIQIFPETIPTLKQLSSYPKVIITNSPRSCVKQILKHYNLEAYFQHVVTSDDVQKSKPAPDLIYKACALLQITPQEVVMIGDTEHDVTAGRAADCFVIGLKVQGDAIIQRLDELPNLLKKSS